jgi:hypothetical protein
VLRDPGSIVVAFLVAAAVGGAIAGLLFSLAFLVNDLAPGVAHWTGLYMVVVLIVLGIAAGFVGYLVGLAVLVAPLWAVLHRLGRRDRTLAVLLGAGVSIVVAVLSHGGDDTARNLLYAVAVLAVAGGTSGWVLHRMSYRPRR